MTTTAIFAEILIIGLEATMWLCVLVAAIFGTRWIPLARLENWETPISLFVLAFAYALGIIVDRVADSLFDPLDRRLRTSKGEKSPLPPVPEMRLCVLAEGGGMATFLDYVRSRIRVARSTAFNLFLLTLSVIILLRRMGAPADGAANPGRLIVWVAAVGVGLVAAAVFAWARITKTYYWRLGEAYRVVCETRAGTVATKEGNG
jgi:hypothetical protein